MTVVQHCELPESAFLRAYQSHAYVDCFAADIALPVSLEQFVAAFYTTSLFKLERRILKWAVSKPSTDDEARQLAAGSIVEFAAWYVEERAPNQLLLSDMNNRTRSWLMIAPAPSSDSPATRLYFGSAVVPTRNRRSGNAEMGFAFRALLGFHKLYSVALLRAAASKLHAAAARKS